MESTIKHLVMKKREEKEGNGKKSRNARQEESKWWCTLTFWAWPPCTSSMQLSSTSYTCIHAHSNVTPCRVLLATMFEAGFVLVMQ